MHNVLNLINRCRRNNLVAGYRYFTKNLMLRVAIACGNPPRQPSSLIPGYDHHRDKHPVRFKHHGQSGWKPEPDGPLRHRDYDSYDEYKTHQAQKYTEILAMKGGFTSSQILMFRMKFYRRFRHLPNYLPRSSTILCAGARQGTEVEVLRDLGFHSAFGIDLNPGPDNKYVQPGDFMALDYPDASIDMIYSNCLDHAYDLDQFFREHARVLKPNGLALYDIAANNPAEPKPFEAIEWTSDEAVFVMMLNHFDRVLKVETEKAWKWVLLQKADPSA